MSVDSRILWLSPDKTQAVVRASDIPERVPVGLYRAVWSDLTTAVATAAADKVGVYPNEPTAGPNRVCKVETKHLVGWDLGVVNATFHVSGPMGFYQPKKIKDWPHDCPRCKGRECALQLATTWDCRKGCFK